jgi:hypothetical protein
MTAHGDSLRAVLQQARIAKVALLEATDEFQALEELLAGHALVQARKPAGNTSPGGLLRAARGRLELADKDALDSLTIFMDVLALLEQAVTDGPILICRGCDATVRITKRLADQVQKGAICVACHGELVPVEVAGIVGLGDPS